MPSIPITLFTPKNMIIIHHSLTKDGETVSWSAIEKFHKEVNGWKDIGYHYGVERVNKTNNLVALVGRDELDTAAAVKEADFNVRGIHICVVGNFDEKAPDTETLEFITKRLIVPIMRRHKISPSEIYPHSRFASYKTCPGKLFPIDELVRLAKAGWKR